MSFGSPLTVMPQLPQMPMRHDQRYDKVASMRSLTWFSPSSTTHSFGQGTSYSSKVAAQIPAPDGTALPAG